jgi:NADPH2:quinone reductase
LVTGGTTMLAVRYHEHGGPEVLQCEAVEVPRPEENEELIHIEAGGVNYADTVRRNGDYYPVPTVFPAIPGGEIVGSIEALGASVENREIMTMVFALINQGGYAQHAAAPARGIIPIPEGLDSVPGSFLASLMRPDIENFEVQYKATETLRKTMKTKQG